MNYADIKKKGGKGERFSSFAYNGIIFGTYIMCFIIFHGGTSQNGVLSVDITEQIKYMGRNCMAQMCMSACMCM